MIDFLKATGIGPNGLCPWCSPDGNISAGICRECLQVVKVYTCPCPEETHWVRVFVFEASAKGVG